MLTNPTITNADHLKRGGGGAQTYDQFEPVSDQQVNKMNRICSSVVVFKPRVERATRSRVIQSE